MEGWGAELHDRPSLESQVEPLQQMQCKGVRLCQGGTQAEGLMCCCHSSSQCWARKVHANAVHAMNSRLHNRGMHFLN
jgi:hypothetical protein